MNKFNTALLALICTVSTQSTFASSKMNNPAIEGLSFLDKMDLYAVLLEIKSLPEEVRLALCNGALLNYLNSQEYYGDFDIVKETFSEVDDLSQNARLALTQVATKRLDDNGGKCTLKSMQKTRDDLEEKKKGGGRGFWSLWN